MAMSGLCSVGLSDKATIFILTSDTKLKVPRVGHDSVVWDNYIVIVGGEGVRKHEIWEWREDEQDFDVFIQAYSNDIKLNLWHITGKGAWV